MCVSVRLTPLSREEFYKLEPEFGDLVLKWIYHADMLVYQNQVVYGANHLQMWEWGNLFFTYSLFIVGVWLIKGSSLPGPIVEVSSSWTIEIKKIEGYKIGE